MSTPALKMWKRKLDSLLIAEAAASNPAQKFELAQQIQEAKAKISEFQQQRMNGTAISLHSPPATPVDNCHAQAVTSTWLTRTLHVRLCYEAHEITLRYSATRSSKAFSLMVDGVTIAEKGLGMLSFCKHAFNFTLTDGPSNRVAALECHANLLEKLKGVRLIVDGLVLYSEK